MIDPGNLQLIKLVTGLPWTIPCFPVGSEDEGAGFEIADAGGDDSCALGISGSCLI